MDDVNALIDSSAWMDCQSITDCVDHIYEGVVDALRLSAHMFIPKRKCNFYKFWWSLELDTMKEKAIESCRMWKDTGRPKSGPIYTQYKKDKLLYKKRIREEQVAETSYFTNDLHEALLRKSGQEFWKVWKSKFPNASADIVQVDGVADCAVIATNFAKHFESVCKSVKTHNEALKTKYNALRAHYCGSVLTDEQVFDAELLSRLINSLKRGKAAGLDELTCEHLQHSHPIVVSILVKLFNLFVATGHIPTTFGASYTVPIPKCDGRTKALSVDDFRGISISPVVSKLFEMAILDRFSKFFETSDHQYGFKKHLSCRDAIYTVRQVTERYISNGSTVNMCTLDLSKAFDRTNHYALLIKLMNRNLPVQLLTILELWFRVSVTCVSWNGHFSAFYSLTAGVRQGGVLSPFLFAVFIDGIVDKVQSLNVGCYISTMCCCIFLYADDILLLAPSVSGLQILLNACEEELSALDMYINQRKSMCIRFGKRFAEKCAELVTASGERLRWVDRCRYLGVYFTSGCTLRCCFDDAKSRFFRAFNAILSKTGRCASEPVVLSLLRSKCMPILLYAVEACPLLARQTLSFEFTLTRIFMKLFRTGSAKVASECQLSFGFLPAKSQILIRTASFLNKFTACENSLCMLFANDARRQLHNIFIQFGDNIKTVRQLRNAVLSKFFDFS